MSVGTLFAFVIVCAAVLILRYRSPEIERPFRAPALPLVAALGILVNGGLMFSLGPRQLDSPDRLAGDRAGDLLRLQPISHQARPQARILGGAGVAVPKTRLECPLTPGGQLMNKSSIKKTIGWPASVSGTALRRKRVRAILILAVVATITGSGQAPRLADPDPANRISSTTLFVKIGKRYVNLYYVTSVEEYPGRNGLKVYFEDRERFLYFGDAEADVLRKVLDSVLMNTPVGAGKPDAAAPDEKPR